MMDDGTLLRCCEPFSEAQGIPHGQGAKWRQDLQTHSSTLQKVDVHKGRGLKLYVQEQNQ